jgi:hypothetical protein
VAAYFGAANGTSTVLYSYNERGGEISSTEGAKLQRERRGRKCFSAGCSKMQRQTYSIIFGAATFSCVRWRSTRALPRGKPAVNLPRRSFDAAVEDALISLSCLSRARLFQGNFSKVTIVPSVVSVLHIEQNP